MRKASILLFLVVFSQLCSYGQDIASDRNRPDRKEWFADLGFGMFIHWSVDVQLGAIISHNVAVSSRDYQERYFQDLPALFNPKKFDPDEWARLAKLAGMKYMVFTAKHHNGFCMWDTATTGFNVMKSGLRRDVLKEVLDAFRRQGIAVGLYFSPDDFHMMYQQGYPPSRSSREADCRYNPELWELNKAQLRELLTGYGKIDILFIDENTRGVKPLVSNYAWDLDPDLLITRGSMKTPEQKLPGQALEPPWEACFTIGSHWQYVATDTNKDATTLIQMLIETRAKGGNLLLNVGPDAHGEIPEVQALRLREIGLWHMANHEAVDGIRPWKITHENDAWFTCSKDGSAVYAFVNAPSWGWLLERAFFFRCLTGTEHTRASVLGQNDQMMEYPPVDRSPRTLWAVTDEGVFVNAVRAQRLNKTWVNPLVIKFEGVGFREPGK